MVAEFLTALKAISAIPDLLRQITVGLEQVSLARKNEELERIKNEALKIIDRIQNTSDRNELLKLARDLNRTLS